MWYDSKLHNKLEEVECAILMFVEHWNLTLTGLSNAQTNSKKSIYTCHTNTAGTSPTMGVLIHQYFSAFDFLIAYFENFLDIIVNGDINRSLTKCYMLLITYCLQLAAMDSIILVL